MKKSERDKLRELVLKSKSFIRVEIYQGDGMPTLITPFTEEYFLDLLNYTDRLEDALKVIAAAPIEANTPDFYLNHLAEQALEGNFESEKNSHTERLAKLLIEAKRVLAVHPTEGSGE